jgi:hypothetical protein
MSILPNEDWRGEHLWHVPRAPKPDPVSPPRGFISDHVHAKICRLGREGLICGKIAQQTGVSVWKVRDVLTRAGIDYALGKPATVKRVNKRLKAKLG